MPAVIDLGLSFILGYGSFITYTGLQTINADANALGLTVFATFEDDSVVVTPFDAASGRLIANGTDPIINYSNLGPTLTVDLLSGGEDRLTVRGNSTSEVITVNAVSVVASGQTINYLNSEALRVDGLEGNDIFNVTASAATEIFIDGGDAIGVTGDTLNLTAIGATTYAPGPESDEGGFTFAGGQPVSYDHIEAATLNFGRQYVTSAWHKCRRRHQRGWNGSLLPIPFR